MEKYFDLDKTGRITKTDVFFNQAETVEHIGHLLIYIKCNEQYSVFCILNFNLAKF